MIKQLSVFVEDVPGAIMRITSALTETDVNIRAISAFDTPDFGILRLIVDKPTEAKGYLTGKGFVVRVQDVIGVELVDQGGSLNQMLAVLNENEININYIYSFVIRGGKAPVMVLYTEDTMKAEKVLADADIKIVDKLG